MLLLRLSVPIVDMVLFDFNQESVDTTFVDESLIDDAPVVAPPMPLPPAK